MIKVIDRSENKIYDNNKNLIDKFTEFSTENLGFDKPVTVYFSDDYENAKNPLGQTAHYNPESMEIHIKVTNRHLKDILRSISHELIHHVQNCRGDLENVSDTEDGYAQRDDHMRDMEHEAYTSGNIMNFRDFEDKFKSENSIMNENHFKKNRLKALHELLMEQSKAGAAIRAEREKRREEKKEGGSALPSSVATALQYESGRTILKKVATKLGFSAPSKVAQASAGGMRTYLMRLGPAAVGKITAIAGDIAAFQALSAEAGMAATASAAGAGTTAAAFGAAAAAGAAIGTLAGYLINKAAYTGFGEEMEERLSRATKDLNYAKAEMDLYCKGAGSLCRDDVECSGKPGGYVYDTAEGLGIDEGGREKFGVFDRRYRQTPNAFHSRDGAAMVAMLSAIVAHDLKSGKIKFTGGKKAEVANDAEIKAYEGCAKKYLTMSSIMLNKIKQAGLQNQYGTLMLALGFKALPEAPKGKGASVGPTKGGKCDNYPVVPGCKGNPVGNLVAIITQATKMGQEAYNKDRKRVENMYNNNVYTPDVFEYIKTGLEELSPNAAQEFVKNKGALTGQKDDVVIMFLNKIAKEKKIQENKKPKTLKEQRLFELNKELMKRLK